MRPNNLLIILISYLLLISPSVASETILFEENFNSEPTARWVYNYDSFYNWDVYDGFVDLLNANHYGFEHLSTYGFFVDLDGTNLDDTYPSLGAGRLESKQTFYFIPGYTYRLAFDLAGSQAFWLPHPNTVNISLGDIYNKEVTLDTYEPFKTFEYAFDVTSPTNAKLIFEHFGNDQVGLLLDNIKITSTLKYDLIGREYFPGITINNTTYGARFTGKIINGKGIAVGHFDVSTDHQGGPIESCGATNTLVRFKITMKFFDGRRLVMIMPYGETADANWDWDDDACPYGGRECDFYSLDNLVSCDSDENPDVSLIAKVNSIPLTKRQFGSWGFDELEAGHVEGWLIHTPPIFPVVIGTFTGE